MPPTVPANIDDPINQQILRISEDQITGFQREPFAAIATQSGVDEPTVIERVRAMMGAGTIRRVRQTLMANKLAPGALVAWQVPTDQLNTAFDYLMRDDPFSGHVVIRSTDADTAGSAYRLWTTLKVPQGYSPEKHCAYLATQIHASAHRLMPAHKLFRLGVGHLRRRDLEPGHKLDQPGEPYDTEIVPLTKTEWQVMTALKREFTADEIQPNPWAPRAAEAGMPWDRFCQIAESLDQRGVLGRFSTFLEHIKKHKDGSVVTRYNALFHWAVPKGRELEAGGEVARHTCMTHAYWREGGPEFNHVNIMGVIHGTDQQLVLAHKQAIDDHLAKIDIPVSYTNVFWGGRSEIKPSEIAPEAYVQWCEEMGIDAHAMRAE